MIFLWFQCHSFDLRDVLSFIPPAFRFFKECVEMIASKKGGQELGL